MMQVEQNERNILIREADLLEAEPFLSLARRFQKMGLEFDAILPWIETVTEVAQGTDAKTAAMYLAYELSAFRKLGSFPRTYITIIVYARYRLLTRLTCWPAVKEYHQCFSDCHQS